MRSPGSAHPHRPHPTGLLRRLLSPWPWLHCPRLPTFPPRPRQPQPPPPPPGPPCRVCVDSTSVGHTLRQARMPRCTWRRRLGAAPGTRRPGRSSRRRSGRRTGRARRSGRSGTRRTARRAGRGSRRTRRCQPRRPPPPSPLRSCTGTLAGSAALGKATSCLAVCRPAAHRARGLRRLQCPAPLCMSRRADTGWSCSCRSQLPPPRGLRAARPCRPRRRRRRPAARWPAATDCRWIREEGPGRAPHWA